MAPNVSNIFSVPGADFFENSLLISLFSGNLSLVCSLGVRGAGAQRGACVKESLRGSAKFAAVRKKNPGGGVGNSLPIRRREIASSH